MLKYCTVCQYKQLEQLASDGRAERSQISDQRVAVDRSSGCSHAHVWNRELPESQPWRIHPLFPLQYERSG